MTAPAFVLHPDLEVLSALVGGLRARGIECVHADGVTRLLERLRQGQPSILIAPSGPIVGLQPGELDALREAIPGVEEVSVPVDTTAASIARLVEHVTARLAAQPAQASGPPPSTGEIRGDLAQATLGDLLQLFSTGRRTGTLAVTGEAAAGEIRLVEGEVVDAVYRRADGMKAIVRLLGLREAIAKLLMEGSRQLDEIRRCLERLGLSEELGRPRVALHVTSTRRSSDPKLEEVADLLAAPRTLEDFLDESPRSDLELVKSLSALHADGRLSRVPLHELRPSLAGPEGMVVLRGLVRRLRPRGFRGATRMILTGAAHTVNQLRAALVRIAEAVPGNDVSFDGSGFGRGIELTVQLQLGENIVLDVITVVDRQELLPLLPMTLGGCIALVHLDRPSQALVEAVEEVEAAMIDARALSNFEPSGMTDGLDTKAYDPSDPTMVASLLRGAIESLGET